LGAEILRDLAPQRFRTEADQMFPRALMVEIPDIFRAKGAKNSGMTPPYLAILTLKSKSIIVRVGQTGAGQTGSVTKKNPGTPRGAFAHRVAGMIAKTTLTSQPHFI
jgi:hypothetical protein